MNSKTISKIVVSTLPAVCLIAHTTSDCHAGELLREIQSEQRKLPYTTQNQVMQNVFKDYDNLNIELKNTLDILWHNDAGNLLLRCLHNVIKNDNRQITILWDTCDEKDESNYFRYKDSAILLNNDKFGDYVAYCDGDIYALPEQLDTVLFYEMCHALHNLEDTMACKQQRFVPAFYKLSENDTICKITCKAWTDDEEIRTITGWYVDDDETLKFDWLNTNAYIVLKELKNETLPKDIMQRVFHCDRLSLDFVYKTAKRERLDELIIPLEKYIDA